MFALSAAVWCERQSSAAAAAGLLFPVRPGFTDTVAKVHLAAAGGGALDPPFTVPARYFYALTAVLPPQVARSQRYDMAILQDAGRAAAALGQAVDDAVIVEDAAVDRFAAARRLGALGLAAEPNVPTYPVVAGDDVAHLITGWLASAGPDIGAFWTSLDAAGRRGHLQLALCAVTGAHQPLMTAITTTLGVVDVAGLAALTRQSWTDLFDAQPDLLPAFTAPGTVGERTEAFLRHLRRFFTVSAAVAVPGSPEAGTVPVLERSADGPIERLIEALPGFEFTGWDENDLTAALELAFPDDPDARADLAVRLGGIRDVLALTAGIAPDSLRFAVTEALWARGVTSPARLQGHGLDAVRDALRGTVAFEHATRIWENAGSPGAELAPPAGGFTAVYPDGSLVNCIPPEHLSPFGLVAYLTVLLRLSADTTCEDPLPEGPAESLAALLATRRGPLGDLLASPANLATRIPMIDIVGESLAHMVATGEPHGVVLDTADDALDGYPLDTAVPPAAERPHDAEVLFRALPEHATPATPTADPGAWDVLRQDFSAPTLPYHQPLDVLRTHLGRLGTTRAATMRRFRRHITEYVLDPDHEPAEFRTHLWRYPLRREIALEYLGVSPEEAAVLFSPDGLDPSELPTHFGFPVGDEQWLATVLRLPELLARAGLTYCELRELWRDGYVGFEVRVGRQTRELPECEPCCLDEYTIRVTDPEDPAAALTRLDAFVRLWRRLAAAGHAWTITELADVARVLRLDDGAQPNPDFLRQLAALQLLRDLFDLPLTDGTAPAPGATGADRTHLLALWVPGDPHLDWAITLLLERVQAHAIATYDCPCLPPVFLKLLRENLDPISRLAGFDPDDPAATWSAHPTHTLRLFADILVKLYASDFEVGEVLYLFTADPQAQGADPFPAQTDNEARDRPFALPDDEPDHDLFALRGRLRGVDSGDGAEWTWSGMTAVLHTRFGMPLPPAGDHWFSLGRHFFPGVLAAEGHPVAPADRRYAVPLAATSTEMWNTGGGPFRHDPVAETLSVAVGLPDGEVIAKLARIRQLSPEERAAVSDLRQWPRWELAFFSFLFDDQHEAESRLVEETDEAARWAWFQWAVARFVARCETVAEHLAEHVRHVTGRAAPDDVEAARTVLRHLHAAENLATSSWEDDNGHAPDVTWGPLPLGGAFQAVLGVIGTGLLAEFRTPTGGLRWRDVRGGLTAFGRARNAADAPVPTVIPAMDLVATADQQRFVTIRNGFAMADDDGSALGGAEPFTLHWSGLLLIECGGEYAFAAGAPTAAGDLPDADALCDTHRWSVSLRQGQRSWRLLAHDATVDGTPRDCSVPIRLERGFYELTIELERLAPDLDGPEEPGRATTGFQLTYDGPDAGGTWVTVPRDKLFVASKDGGLQEGIDPETSEPGVVALLAARYVSTVRDVRRTYQAAFKALLFVRRLGLRAVPVSDDGQSELGFLLAHPEAFRGQSHYRTGAGIATHRADFDLDLLPLLDNYHPPTPAADARVAPSAQRTEALFDWWERLVDYTVMRAATTRSPERPVWLLFHEAAEAHEDDPAHLLRHMGVDIRHDELVLQQYDPAAAGSTYAISSQDLIDDRWAVRVLARRPLGAGRDARVRGAGHRSGPGPPLGLRRAAAGRAPGPDPVRPRRLPRERAAAPLRRARAPRRRAAGAGTGGAADVADPAGPGAPARRRHGPHAAGRG